MASSSRHILLPALIAAALLAGCSKTVQWEEEVPLNTGDTIWVKRTVVYSLQGGAGNPLDISYRPDWPETINFEWRGKNYQYTGDAVVMLLAISPQDLPVLVARAFDGAWNWKHDYACVTPFYVQLTPDESGRNWVWPMAIESWLYGMSHNLMRARTRPENMRERYTAQQRTIEDAVGAIQSPSSVQIDPLHSVKSCKPRR